MIVLPVLIIVIISYGIYKKINVFEAFTDGISKGFSIIMKISPTIIGLVTAVFMLRASGVIDEVTKLVTPLFLATKIPPEVTPLMLLKPISGGGGFAIGSEIIKTYGADSYIGRVAAVMLASSETSIYTMSIYYGSLGINKIKYTLICALFADFVAFFMSAYTVFYFFNQ